jgi:hypothetical protein
MNLVFALFSISFISTISVYCSKGWNRINLPDEQIPYYFNLKPRMKNKCANDDLCPYKHHLNSTKCYGYEKNCKPEGKFNLIECPDDSKGWVSL